MSLDVKAVVDLMLKAAAVPLEAYWKKAAPVAQSEFSAIAQLVAQIGIDRETQTITPEDADDMLEQAKLAAKTAMDTQAGMGQMAAEDAINAALGAVSSIINGYLGFALI